MITNTCHEYATSVTDAEQLSVTLSNAKTVVRLTGWVAI